MENEIIYLRAFEPDDYKLINQWRNNKKIWENTVGRFKYVSSEMEKAWVDKVMNNNRTDVYLAVCRVEDDVMIGYTSINDIDYVNRTAMWGGTVIGDEKSHSGLEYFGMLRQVLEYAFKDLSIHRLYGSCLEKYLISRTMMEMVGMKYEATFRDSAFRHNEYVNVVQYAILDYEYFSIQKENGYTNEAMALRSIDIRKRIKKEIKALEQI